MLRCNSNYASINLPKRNQMTTVIFIVFILFQLLFPTVTRIASMNQEKYLFAWQKSRIKKNNGQLKRRKKDKVREIKVYEVTEHLRNKNKLIMKYLIRLIISMKKRKFLTKCLVLIHTIPKKRLVIMRKSIKQFLLLCRNEK